MLELNHNNNSKPSIIYLTSTLNIILASYHSIHWDMKQHLYLEVLNPELSDKQCISHRMGDHKKLGIGLKNDCPTFFN